MIRKNQKLNLKRTLIFLLNQPVVFIPMYSKLESFQGQTFFFFFFQKLSPNQNSKGQNFVFYQTLKGFRFVSIETLYQGGFQGYTKRDPVDSKFKHYVDNPVQEEKGPKIGYIPDFNETYNSVLRVNKCIMFIIIPGNVDGISDYRKKFRVTEFDLISSFDTMRNLGMGMYRKQSDYT